MKIGKANIEDAEEILKLQRLAYKSEAEIYNDFNIQPLTQNLNEIINEFNDLFVLKVIDKNKIIGSVRANLNGITCYIGKLIVHPDYQNNGIGKILMNNIEEQFNKADRYELFTGFKSDKNIYLYNKLSYHIFKTVVINDNLSLLYFEKFVV